MGRSDGNFPPYDRLDIDPLRPPEGYWEGARKCQECERLWPNYMIFDPSPCCDSDTLVVTDENVGDLSWREACKALLDARFRRWYNEWNEDKEDIDFVAEVEVTALDHIEEEFEPKEASHEL